MKVEEIKQELFRLIADYEKCFEDPNRKDFYAPVLTPIGRNTYFAIKEELSRMDKSYRKAKREDFEWPENILFALGFDLAFKPDKKQEEGLKYVMDELLSDTEKEVLLRH